jgi:hypothetical protein
MAEPKILNLTPIREGESWDGIDEISLESDGTSLSEPLAKVELIFNDSRGIEVLRLESPAGVEITEEGPEVWTFTVPAINDFPLVEGNYAYMLWLTNASGRRKPYLTGSQQVSSRGGNPPSTP